MYAAHSSVQSTAYTPEPHHPAFPVSETYCSLHESLIPFFLTSQCKCNKIRAVSWHCIRGGIGGKKHEAVRQLTRWIKHSVWGPVAIGDWWRHLGQ